MEAALLVRLEISAQRELQVACVVGLAGDFPEGTAGGVEVGAAPVRVIEGVEGLCTELEADPFIDRKLLIQADVPIRKARIMNGITNSVLRCESSLGGRHKDGSAI